MHASMESRPVEVAVLARNALGKIEVLFCPMQCTAEEVAEGGHFVRANREAQAQGLSPLQALDESEPAWRMLVNGRKYERFFDDATEILQDCLVEGREPSGADTIANVGELFRPYGQEMVHLAVSPDGYWSNRNGWVEDAHWATLVRSPESLASLRQLTASGPVKVVSLPISALDELHEYPTLEDLQSAADEAVRLSERLKTPITEANAAQVMAYQLDMHRIKVPASAAPLLQMALMNAVSARQAQRDGEAGGTPGPRPPGEGQH